METGEDFMLFQRYEDDEWKDRVVTSDADGADGETLTGETREDQIAAALVKLNAYVAASPTIDGVKLQTWTIEEGSNYPIFDSKSGPSTLVPVINQKPQIITYADGFEVIAQNLSRVDIFNVSGQKIMQVVANNERVYVIPETSGLVILSGYDINGKRLFAEKYIIK